MRTVAAWRRFGWCLAALSLCGWWLGRLAGAPPLAKFEPEDGCYIGAFVERDPVVKGNYGEFERLTGKRHASYFTYVGYGRPFPDAWVAKVRDHGAAPHIAFEPNQGLEFVQDDEYLQQFADDCYAADCPIFMRFASEMNGRWSAYYGDPQRYRQKFRLVHDVMARRAPNVAMVWTPFAVPRNNIDDYYPGDDYVDWVGVNIYSVYVHNGDPEQQAWQEDPVDFLRYVYDRYADRKPIQVSEFAATHYCRAMAKDTTDFAREKMQRFYATVAEDFPRVKMINWFSMDTIGAEVADNDYALTNNDDVLTTYRSLVASAHFLSRVPYDRSAFRTATAPPLTTEGGERLPTYPRQPPRPARAVEAPKPAPPRPYKPAPPPERPYWDASQEEDLTEILSTRAAIVRATSRVLLSGLKPGVTVDGTVELVAVAPAKLDVFYVAFELDGRIVAITNIVPYRVLIRGPLLPPGRHEIRALVFDSQREEHASARLAFVAAPAP